MIVLVTDNGPEIGNFDMAETGDYFERTEMRGRPRFFAREDVEQVLPIAAARAAGLVE